MTISFRTLCTLEVTHEYYSGPCPDFDFVIPVETAERLRRGRLLARVLDGRLHVLFETDGGGAPLTSLAGQTLRIGLALRNPYFANFTAPTPVPTSALGIYRRLPGAAQLTGPDTAVPVSARFSHVPSKADRPVTVTVKDPGQVTIATRTLAAGDPTNDISFDFSGRREGLYAFTEDYPAAAQVSLMRYFHPELVTQAAAVVEIAVDAALYAAAQPLALTVAFTARQETLNYYVVAREHTPVELSQLNVVDGGAAPKLTFTRIDAAGFTPAEIPAALLGNGDAKVVLFRSTPTSRRARGRARIELRRNNVVVIPNLPQPGADRTRADLIVHVSKKP